jgi:ADP-ribose pyrophosphatase
MTAMSYSVIDSKTIYQGRVFEVRQDQIQLPDGTQAQMDILDHAGAVVILPVDKNGRIWFIRQYRHAIAQQLLELPAGGLEPDETPQACAERELREEIGMGARKMQALGGFYLAPGYSSEYLHVFLATDLFPAPLIGDPDEFIEVDQMPVGDFLNLALNGTLVDSKTLSTLLLAQKHLV